MLRYAALLVVVGVGLAIMGIAVGWGLQHDWPLLDAAYLRRVEVARVGDLKSVIVAQGAETALRINVFADGTWLILGAIVVAIGVHGLCVVGTRGPQA